MLRILRRSLASVIALTVLVFATIVVIGFVHDLDAFPSTDDATIDAEVVHVAPSVSGRIVRLPVEENQLVAEGDVLFEIDPQPYQIRVDIEKAGLEQAKALLATTKRTVATETTNASVAENQVKQARESLRLATSTLARLEPLLGRGYVSAQQVDMARTDKAKAATAYQQAQEQAAASMTAIDTVDGAVAAVDARRSSLALAERDLRETVVHATHAGRVTGLGVRTGEYANLSQALFTLVVSEEWFASANFRETELGAITVGTCATAYSLIDRTVPIRGRVDSIGYGVADGDRINLPRGVPYVQKSVNWVRVSQRFPVRVRLLDPPADLMRLGASALVRVHAGKRC